MKKLILLLCVLLASLLILSAAFADTASVRFAKSSGQVNGGFTYTLTMKVKKAAEQDLVIPLTCKENGDKLTVTIPAGSTEGTAEYMTQPVEKSTSLTFTAEPGEGYSLKSDKFTLKVLSLPKVKFGRSIYFGYAGRTATINITFTNPGNVVRGSVFQLRNQHGTVLCEKSWSSGSGSHSFQVQVTPEMNGKNLLSVWLGDYKISEKNGYGAFTDLSRKAVRTIPTTEPWVAITLDCGWYGDQMPLVLPTLEKYGAHCTFFMTGFFIRTFTKEALNAIEGGHEIANHTNFHPKMAKNKRKINRLNQVAIPNQDAQKLLGVRPRLFRPPYGDYDEETMALVRAEGMEIIIWTVDSHDWDKKYDYNKIWKRVTKSIKPGDIILFHLNGHHTPAILEKLIPYIQDELGYKCVTVSELLASAGMDLPPLVEEGTDEFLEPEKEQDTIPAGSSEG